MADHVASSPGMNALPKEDPFTGEQQSLFQGGPSDARNPEPNTFAPGQAPASEPEPTAAAPAGTKSEAELLRERVEAQDRMIERMLAGQGQPVAPAAPPAPTIVPPGPPPDAVTKPLEFAQWLDKKLTYERQLNEAALNERERRTEAATNLDRLWQRFQRDYSDQAEDEDLVAAAFQKVVQRNGGVMPADHQQLMKSVADQVDAWRGGAPKREPAAGRTNGLSPGSARKGAKRETPAEEKPVRFSDQLADIQLKTGFF